NHSSQAKALCNQLLFLLQRNRRTRSATFPTRENCDVERELRRASLRHAMRQNRFAHVAARPPPTAPNLQQARPSGKTGQDHSDSGVLKSLVEQGTKTGQLFRGSKF